MTDILKLPSSLLVGGEEREINSDFRPCIYIMQIFERADLTVFEKTEIMVGILFVDELPVELIQEAAEKAVWFLNMGDTEESEGGRDYGRLFSWEQDLRFIIAAVDKSAGCSVRIKEHYHWWEFISAFYESGECVFNTIVHQRKLKKSGKQTKTDKEWWAENRDIAELKIEKQLTLEEQRALDKFNALLKGGGANG